MGTISDLTAEQLLRLEFRKARKDGGREELADDTTYILGLVTLHPSVTPGDYAALKAEIESITGIQNFNRLSDHHTRATTIANHTQVVDWRADVNLRDDTPEP